MNCPTCKASTVHLTSKHYVFYPLALLIILSVPLATLHQASAPCSYRCSGCGADFLRRTVTARVTYAVMILFVVGFILALTITVAAIVFTSRK